MVLRIDHSCVISRIHLNNPITWSHKWKLNRKGLQKYSKVMRLGFELTFKTPVLNSSFVFWLTKTVVYWSIWRCPFCTGLCTQDCEESVGPLVLGVLQSNSEWHRVKGTDGSRVRTQTRWSLTQLNVKEEFFLQGSRGPGIWSYEGELLFTGSLPPSLGFSPR